MTMVSQSIHIKKKQGLSLLEHSQVKLLKDAVTGSKHGTVQKERRKKCDIACTWSIQGKTQN